MSCTKGEGDIDVAVSSWVTDIIGGISGAEDESSAAATIEAATVNGISVSCPARTPPWPETECIIKKKIVKSNL